jgi:hypothetical protein
MVRLALVHLGVGATAGVLLLAARASPAAAGTWSLRPAHADLLLAGWLLQLACGVAYWILPRIRGERPRAPATYAGAALLNAGVAAATVGVAAGAADAVLPWARAGEAAGLALVAASLWPRVRTAGRTGGGLRA